MRFAMATQFPNGSPAAETTLLERMRRLSAAEEFFDLLGVSYDPKVVQVARLHILRRMATYLAKSGLDSLTEDAAAEACRAALARAYADFVASSPIDEREFKVLKNAARPTQLGYVSFDSIAVGGES
jgi:nitrogenase-stabilizing/protective protein